MEWAEHGKVSSVKSIGSYVVFKVENVWFIWLGIKINKIIFIIKNDLDIRFAMQYVVIC